MSRTVAVVDYGMGNLRSVAKALEYVAPDARVLVTSDAAAIAAAERVVMPGQGAMPDCMREFTARGLRETIVKVAAEKPFLGICVGEQMLFGHAEEGNVMGLEILPGSVPRFPAGLHDAAGELLKVPHMGWNEVVQTQSHALWKDIPDGARFYFVHSYFVLPDDPAVTVGRTHYGIPFTSAVGRANIFATQFHPEKSAEAGLQLLKNFMHWQP